MSIVLKIILLILFSALTACEKSQPSDENAVKNSALVPRKKQIVVALVLKTQTNPFFIAMERGARQAEQENGIRLITRGGSQETYVQEQIQLVEDTIEAKVDAIVIAPGDSTLLVPVIKKAQDAGIKVVNIDNPLDRHTMEKLHMAPIPFISVDNEKASHDVTQSVIAKINRPTKVAVINGMAGAENGRLRELGAIRAFKENPAIGLVAEGTANWRIDEAFEVTKKIMQTHPDVKVLFCANDMMALGASQYLSETGKTDVQIIGYDALDEAKAAIRRGRMTATVDQRADVQGYQGVVFALHLLHGEKVADSMMVDTNIVNAQTLN